MYGGKKRTEKDLYEQLPPYSLGIPELRALLGAVIVETLGYPITSKNVHLVTKMKPQHTRNTLRILEVKGLLKCISRPAVISLFASGGGREKVYKLAMSPEDIYRMSSDFRAYISGINEPDLRAFNEEEFLGKLNNLPNTELGKSIIEELKKYNPHKSSIKGSRTY
jgi:hypothetical protein